MKYIAKDSANEPTSLKEHRSTPGASYDDCDKKDIRESLLKEQGYICAYCMQRIKEEFRAGKPLATIEHYEPQSADSSEDLRLNFRNMLAVCTGNGGFAEDLLHCDKSRGNTPLTIDPRQKKCEKHIRYTSSGTIYSDQEDINTDLHETLNLNTFYLKNGRKVAIELAKKQLKSWNEGDIKRAIKKWEQLNKKGQFKPFCQAAIYYLKKKLSSPA